MAKFDPKDHLTKLQGKDYLPVAARILWFVTEVTDGSIEVEVLQTSPYHMVRATIKIGGVVRAVGHGTAPAYDNGRSSWKGRELEKAETAAIGRALAYCGFGTQFAYQDFDEDEHLADAPAEDKSHQQAKPANKPAPAPQTQAEGDESFIAEFVEIVTKDGTKRIIAKSADKKIRASAFTTAAFKPHMDVSPFANDGEYPIPSVRILVKRNGNYLNIDGVQAIETRAASDDMPF